MNAQIHPNDPNDGHYLRIARLQYSHLDGEQGLHIEGVIIPLDSVTVICGRNGAGKSLMAMGLSGLLPRAEVVVERYEQNNMVGTLGSKELRKESGIVFQNSEHQIVGQTVEDDVSFGLKNLRVDTSEIADRVGAIMEVCDIARLSTRHPLSLSGGEIKRVAIAAMMIMEPRILILDEPFLNLDWHAQQQLSSLITTVQQQGITPVVVTHNLSDTRHHVRWMLILSHGTVIAEGAPHSVIDTAVKECIIDKDGAARWRQ